MTSNLFAKCFVFACFCTLATASVTQEFQSGIVWPEPPRVEPGTAATPPSDAIVLFDGKDLSKWVGGENWEIGDGYATIRKADIRTRQAFGDCQLHIEFATPAEVRGNGQGRGNSGVYLMGEYEVQILDSHDNKTYFDGQCAAIYKQQPPTVNASRKPGEWQTYDIIFEAPRFAEDGTVARPAYVTVLHNGVLVHNHFEIQGTTSYYTAPKYTKHAAALPLSIQNHGNPVRVRNIWIRENIQPVRGTKPTATSEKTAKQRTL